MAGLVTSFGSGAATNPLEDIRHADCIVVIGSNTSSQHPLAYARIVDAVHKGATLMVVDPRTTPVAKLATQYLPIQPGTNLALINAVLHVILQEHLYDSDFIAMRTENFSAMAESVKYCTPAWAAEITGLEATEIERMARLYATANNAMILYCMGVTQHVTSTETCRALANLSMLCGMVGRPFTGLLPLRGQNNVQGSCDMGALPESLPGYVPAGSALAKERFTPLWGTFANTCGKPLTEMLASMLHENCAERIKSLYIMGENPALSDADTHSTTKALQSLDFLVVQDLFMTETARLAHVVLPAASYLEKEGTFTNTDRRVQLIDKALMPLGESRPDWRILLDLMQALGHEHTYASPEDVFEEMRTLIPAYAGMTYARLRDEQGLCWPCPSLDHPGTPILHQTTFTRGKGLFTKNDFAVRGQQCSEEFPFILVTGRLAHQYHTGSMTRRSWALEREAPVAQLEMHPEDAKNIGVKDTWTVKVSSAHGFVYAQVHITKNITRGHVFLPFHFVESAANILTSHKYLDPFVKIPEFKVSAVNITEA